MSASVTRTPSAKGVGSHPSSRRAFAADGRASMVRKCSCPLGMSGAMPLNLAQSSPVVETAFATQRGRMAGTRAAGTC